MLTISYLCALIYYSLYYINIFYLNFKTIIENKKYENYGLSDCCNFNILSFNFIDFINMFK